MGEGYAPLGLTVGASLGFNNTFALVTRPDTSRRLGLRRLSDLGRHAESLRVGLFGEFIERADGLPGLVVDRYGPVSVIQCLTLGMARVAPWVVAALTELEV